MLLTRDLPNGIEPMKPATPNQRKSAMQLAKSVMQEAMDDKFYAAGRFRAYFMQKEALEMERKAMAIKRSIKVIERILAEENQ
jgi:hypothetical protein